jgi:hypothetical protein
MKSIPENQGWRIVPMNDDADTPARRPLRGMPTTVGIHAVCQAWH